MNLQFSKETIKIPLWLALAAVPLIAGCDSAGETSAPVDSWYKPPSFDDIIKKPPQLENSRIFRVNAQQQTQAEGLLQKSPIVALSLTQATLFVGKSIKLVGNQKTYLVRGLDPLDGKGNFRVTYQEQKLWVDNSYLGSREPQVIRSPVVLVLDTLPKFVFVTFGAGGV